MLSKLGMAASLLMLWHSSVSDRAFEFWCDSWACSREAKLSPVPLGADSRGWAREGEGPRFLT